MTGWRNAFENMAAVQLHHRALAISTLAAVDNLRYGNVVIVRIITRGNHTGPTASSAPLTFGATAWLKTSHRQNTTAVNCTAMICLIDGGK